MSKTGTKQEVADETRKQLDAIAAHYGKDGIGDPEQFDILACKERILQIVSVMHVPDGHLVRVEANGSHSWQDHKSRPTSASFSVKLSLVKVDT